MVLGYGILVFKVIPTSRIFFFALLALSCGRQAIPPFPEHRIQSQPLGVEFLSQYSGLFTDPETGESLWIGERGQVEVLRSQLEGSPFCTYVESGTILSFSSLSEQDYLIELKINGVQPSSIPEPGRVRSSNCFNRIEKIRNDIPYRYSYQLELFHSNRIRFSPGIDFYRVN